MKVLYFCEGFTDIRFVVGLSEICDLTMAAPAWEFQVSGLADRIAQSGARLTVETIGGRRPVFQVKSLLYCSETSASTTSCSLRTWCGVH